MTISEQERPGILDAIADIRDLLPRKQRQLCNFLLLNYASLGMTTVSELAGRANVGTTTVMRLIRVLKYDTFNDFKKDLLSVAILRESSSYRSIKQTFGRSEPETSSNTFAMICNEAVGAIRNFQTPRNVEQYGKAIELLLNANRINILAQRSSKAAALYLEYSLSSFLPNRVRQLSTDPDFVFDRILGMGEGDIVFVVSNWPCSSGTIEAATTCRERGIPVLLLTNTSVNPISRVCDVMIDTNSVSSPCLLSPAITVIEAISAELGRRTAPGSTANLERLEEMLRTKKLMVW